LASELLFAIDHLDLTDVAIPPEVVGQLNPQAGPMRQVDHVVWMAKDASAGLGVKVVRDDEFWVPYHVPGRPLMPGVMMIEAAAQLASVIYQTKSNRRGFLGFTRCDQVVFRGQVVPGDTLYLLAKEIDFRARRIVCDAQGLVNGKLVFEARITGMVM